MHTKIRNYIKSLIRYNQCSDNSYIKENPPKNIVDENSENHPFVYESGGVLVVMNSKIS